MIDTTEENKWLKEWVKDDADNLGTDLETRTFNALEVEMIMQIYSYEVVTNNVLLHNVSNRRELFYSFLQMLSDDDILSSDNTHDDIIEKFEKTMI